MFSKTLLMAAGAALFAASGAFAQEATPAPELDHFVSTKTRAEVAAETRAAAAAGLMARNDDDMQRIAGQGFRAGKTRVQVAAETAEAKRLGLLSYGEAGAPEATVAQLDAVRLAGERALFGQMQLARK